MSTWPISNGGPHYDTVATNGQSKAKFDCICSACCFLSFFFSFFHATYQWLSSCTCGKLHKIRVVKSAILDNFNKMCNFWIVSHLKNSLDHRIVAICILLLCCNVVNTDLRMMSLKFSLIWFFLFRLRFFNYDSLCQLWSNDEIKYSQQQKHTIVKF